MTDIKLDPKKLLGFKIVAEGHSANVVRSAKIGAKQCTVVDRDPQAKTRRV